MKNKLFNKLSAFSLTVTMGVLLSCSTVFAATPIVTTPVNLNTAGNYVILSASGITNVPKTLITGDIGVSPISSTAITGFGLVMDATNVFSTSDQVTGKVYASDYAGSTASNLTTAGSDMRTAYIDAAGKSCRLYRTIYRRHKWSNTYTRCLQMGHWCFNKFGCYS